MSVPSGSRSWTVRFASPTEPGGYEDVRVMATGTDDAIGKARESHSTQLLLGYWITGRNITVQEDTP